MKQKIVILFILATCHSALFGGQVAKFDEKFRRAKSFAVVSEFGDARHNVWLQSKAYKTGRVERVGVELEQFGGLWCGFGVRTFGRTCLERRLPYGTWLVAQRLLEGTDFGHKSRIGVGGRRWH